MNNYEDIIDTNDEHPMTRYTKYIPTATDIESAPASPAIEHFNSTVGIDDTLPDADDLAVESLVLKSENVTLRAQLEAMTNAYDTTLKQYLEYKKHVRTTVLSVCPMLIHEGRL